VSPSHLSDSDRLVGDCSKETGFGGASSAPSKHIDSGNKTTRNLTGNVCSTASFSFLAFIRRLHMRKVIPKLRPETIASTAGNRVRRNNQRKVSEPRGLTGNSLFLAIYFLLSFNVFQYFPGFSVLREVWLVILCAYLFVLLLTKNITQSKWPFSSYETYVLVLLVSMPIYSAIMANQEFGQPLIYGILTQRETMFAAGVIILIHWVECNRVTLRDVEKVFLWLGWLSLVLYIFIDITVSPAAFSSYVGFVGGGAIEPFHFIFKSVFIKYSVLYYLVRGLMRGSSLDLLKIMPFFFYLVFIDGGRSMLLALFLTAVVMVLQVTSVVRLVVWGPIAAIFAVLLLSGMFYFKGSYMEKLEDRMIAAVSVVVTGKESKDVSANARIEETKLALPYIEKNWLLGNGDLSVRWEKGYFGKVGRFAPSDVGFIGNVFVFGVIGVLFYAVQFLYARRYMKRLPKINRSPFIEASKAFLIYVLIHSLATGAFVYDVHISLMFTALIYLGSRIIKGNKQVFKVSPGHRVLGI